MYKEAPYGTSPDSISVRAGRLSDSCTASCLRSENPVAPKTPLPPYKVKLCSSSRAHLQTCLHYKAILDVPDSKLPSFCLVQPYPALLSLSLSYYLTKLEIIYLSGSLLEASSGIADHI